MGNKDKPVERRCASCDGKITKVAQRVDIMESEVHRIKEDHGAIVERFESHMEKEEIAFKSFYAAIGQLETRISTIVINGMEESSLLKDAIRDESGKFITQKEAIVAIATAAIVASIMIFSFANFSNDVTIEQISTIVKELRKE